MSNLSICRICLGSDVLMKVVENTELRNIYEIMCNNKLQTEDGRPTQVCYLCYTQLKKCHELMIKAVKSDELLTQILEYGIELTESSIKRIDRQHYKLTHRLGKSSMEFTNTFEHVIQQGDAIKEEESNDFEVDNINLTEVECIETSDPLLEEFKIVNNQPDNLSQSANDIPLVNSSNAMDGIVKLEVEDEFKKRTENVFEKSFDKDFKSNAHEITSTKGQQLKELLISTKSSDCVKSPYKCEKCHKGFVFLALYKNSDHMKDIEKTYICTQCDYTKSCSENKKADTKVNTKEKSHSCTLCEFKTVSNGNLKKHMRKHTGEKLYSCSHCDYKCNNNASFIKHMRKHTGEKPYSCTQCDCKFLLRGALKVHLRRTHTKKKILFCTFCGYKNSHGGAFKTHMRIHTGERPFSCTQCEYKCSSSGNLKSHMMKHTGEKPYSCTLCKYKGTHSENLKAHMKTHTGEKPFSCTQCDYKCSTNGNLKKHLKIHEKKTK